MAGASCSEEEEWGAVAMTSGMGMGTGVTVGDRFGRLAQRTLRKGVPLPFRVGMGLGGRRNQTWSGVFWRTVSLGHAHLSIRLFIRASAIYGTCATRQALCCVLRVRAANPQSLASRSSLTPYHLHEFLVSI